MTALVAFWKTYMVARKEWERLQSKNTENKLLWQEWRVYINTKMDAFQKLAAVIPEIRVSEFWRDVTGLRPDAVLDSILFIRRKKLAAKEQRMTEKAILAGAPRNTVR